MVDLRSDTVTLPTEEMLEAIRHAKLGDDNFGEDPTVNALEELAAKKLGKEAALLVTSGTQGNLVSLMVHSRRGDEVILEMDAHIYHFEVGGLCSIAGLVPRLIPGRLGILDPRDVEEAIRPPDIHQPRTSLICIENTHNLAGGICWPQESIKAIGDLAKDHGLAVHMDGARIFNASVALRTDVRELAKPVDSVMFCLSKGLCCPAGSLVVGNEEFIEKARRMRKILGGGMRKAGVLAAPGIIALEKMVGRLEEDHENARRLAIGLSKIPGISIDLKRVQTNIVFFELEKVDLKPQEFLEAINGKGVKALAFGRRIRMVTHMGITKDDIDYALEVCEEVLLKGPSKRRS
ncbi:aminotransferase class I/II-fold pyridoxal phosphate-dependent enzyme [Candidatus Bathyarchaeota archaeon]|nr:aminotransferase class I/II-fold pyridoxal phosphate-dependent enzyme [Candidatus Bathyarchaeota archaeon]MBS7628123.1 aminotransferase class I/II-fold pyridoxal phosphate-dependent enzyme [Candidatus Bathyarchaeota archaeon]